MGAARVLLVGLTLPSAFYSTKIGDTRMKFRSAMLLTGMILSLGMGAHGDVHASAHHVGSKADMHILQVAGQRATYEKVTGIRHWLTAQRAVQSAEIGTDGRTVMIRFVDGLQAAMLADTAHNIRLSHSTFRALDRMRTFSPAGTPRALIMEPVQTELGLGTSAADPEKAALQSNGFAIDELVDTQVTVESMKTLSQYNVVYIHTHSGNNQYGEGVLATGEFAPSNPAQASPSIQPLLADGSVVIVRVAGSTQPYYGITSTFIRDHEGHFPGHSLLFLNGCNLLEAPLFYQALKDKGAGVMVSWTKEASSKDNYLGAAAFFSEMGRGLTVEQALADEKAAGYGISGSGATAASLGFLGDGTITLKQAANPPAASKTPTPTATPTRTPTPAPKSTPTVVPSPGKTPKPPLNLTLRQRVRPGQRQLLTITSSPNTTIHVRIDFPNGDTRSTTLTTSSAGVAHFAFPQHNSKVVFGRVFARVHVQANRGTGVAETTQRYRIGWGKIDAAVSPRQVAVGQTVTVQVHSRANTAVTVFLHFSSGRTKLLRGVTASSGWAQIPYQIQRYLKTPAKHTVTVNARVRLRGNVYHAATSFVIL